MSELEAFLPLLAIQGANSDIMTQYQKVQARYSVSDIKPSGDTLMKENKIVGVEEVFD